MNINQQQADDDQRFTDEGVWIPPDTYRAQVETLERLADRLVELLDTDARLIPDPADFNFLARRIRTAAQHVHRQLPWNLE